MNKTVIILVALLSMYCLKAQKELNDENFEGYLDRQDNTLIVMDFYATWCRPCKVMEPILAELEDEYNQVNFYKMDIDDNVLDDVLELTSVPTYVLIKNGEPLEILEGAMTKLEMEELILKYK